MIAAKKRAAELRRPLRDLVERGLREELRRRGGTRERKGSRVTIRWVTHSGGLLPEVDLTNREAMHDFLRGSR